MDEPTSSLSNHEIDALFKQVKILKEHNVAIIYITHRLKELTEICERVTVLRDGCKVDTMMVKDVTEKDIVNSMVGREMGDYYNKKTHKRGAEVLRVENLTKKGVFENISFTLYEGEILGFSGLVGAGRTEVMLALFGAEHADFGKVYLRGKEFHINAPKEAIDHNIGLVTEDRRRTGLLLEKNIVENIALPSLVYRSDKFGFVNTKWEKKVSEEYMSKLKVKAPDMYTRLANLSGGNQQKVAVGKWLAGGCHLYIFDEPTKGVDVGAKQDIFDLIHEIAKKGNAVIYATCENQELLALTDRIYVMYNGGISAELVTKNTNEDEIMYYSVGGKQTQEEVV